MKKKPNLSSPVKKISLYKKAAFQFLAQDKEGNHIPTKAWRRKKSDGTMDKDFTNGAFEELLKADSNRSVYQYTEIDPVTKTEFTVEQIITSEVNEMIVYKGIIFYKSSATSGSEIDHTNRLNTWVPSLGLDDQSTRGLGSKETVFKITKLDSLYDKKFSNPDARIKKYESYLGTDLMNRLHNFDIMLMSAEIGGGFWDTDNGKNLVKKLKKDGIELKTGSISISSKSEQNHEIPFEIKKTDEALLKDLTKKSNCFFEEQDGYLHKKLELAAKDQDPQKPNVYQEITDRARKATSEYRNYPKSYEKLTSGQPKKEALISLFEDYYEHTFIRGHWNRHHKQEAKVLVQFIKDSSIEDLRLHLNTVIQNLAKEPSMSSKNMENSSFLRRVNFALDLVNPYVPVNETNNMKAQLQALKEGDVGPNTSYSP